jgi:hypothetical protein
VVRWRLRRRRRRRRDDDDDDDEDDEDDEDVGGGGGGGGGGVEVGLEGGRGSARRGRRWSGGGIKRLIVGEGAESASAASASTSARRFAQAALDASGARDATRAGAPASRVVPVQRRAAPTTGRAENNPKDRHRWRPWTGSGSLASGARRRDRSCRPGRRAVSAPDPSGSSYRTRLCL